MARHRPSRGRAPRTPHTRSCRRLHKRAATADWATKRAALEDLEITVEIEGTHWHLEGRVKELAQEGDLLVHSTGLLQ